MVSNYPYCLWNNASVFSQRPSFSSNVNRNRNGKVVRVIRLREAYSTGVVAEVRWSEFLSADAVQLSARAVVFSTGSETPPRTLSHRLHESDLRPRRFTQVGIARCPELLLTLSVPVSDYGFPQVLLVLLCLIHRRRHHLLRHRRPLRTHQTTRTRQLLVSRPALATTMPKALWLPINLRTTTTTATRAVSAHRLRLRTLASEPTTRPNAILVTRNLAEAIRVSATTSSAIGEGPTRRVTVTVIMQQKTNARANASVKAKMSGRRQRLALREGNRLGIRSGVALLQSSVRALAVSAVPSRDHRLHLHLHLLRRPLHHLHGVSVVLNNTRMSMYV